MKNLTLILKSCAFWAKRCWAILILGLRWSLNAMATSLDFAAAMLRRISSAMIPMSSLSDLSRAQQQLIEAARQSSAQTKATDDQLEAITDALLLAMHDLRTVLVRKKADRLPSGE